MIVYKILVVLNFIRPSVCVVGERAQCAWLVSGPSVCGW